MSWYQRVHGRIARPSWMAILTILNGGVALNCAEGHHTHNSGNEVFASFVTLQKIMVDYYFS